MLDLVLHVRIATMIHCLRKLQDYRRLIQLNSRRFFFHSIEILIVIELQLIYSKKLESYCRGDGTHTCLWEPKHLEELFPPELDFQPLHPLSHVAVSLLSVTLWWAYPIKAGAASRWNFGIMPAVFYKPFLCPRRFAFRSAPCHPVKLTKLHTGWEGRWSKGQQIQLFRSCSGSNWNRFSKEVRMRQRYIIKEVSPGILL